MDNHPIDRRQFQATGKSPGIDDVNLYSLSTRGELKKSFAEPKNKNNLNVYPAQSFTLTPKKKEK